MKRAFCSIALFGLLCAPAVADSYYFTPDVPTDDPAGGAATYLPWTIGRNDSGAYSLLQTLPEGTALDALHRLDAGDWLFSVEAPATLGVVTYEPRDVVLFSAGGFSPYWSGAANGLPSAADVDALFLDGSDAGDLVVSFAAPTTLGGSTYDPADLVRFQAGVASLYFDASATTPPIPSTTNVTGAEQRGDLVLLTFDVPTTLDASTHLPGELVAWDSGAGFASYQSDPAWPPSSRADALSFLASPGLVPPTLAMAKSSSVAGNVVLDWSASCSAGAEDYGIYEGTLGSWYSHTALLCGDPGNDEVEDLAPGGGDRYYLVVAHNANDEGSYGPGWPAGERDVGDPVACRATREVQPCP